MLENTDEAEDCQFEDQNEEAVSLIMQRLNQTTVNAKRMTDLQRLSSQKYSKAMRNTRILASQPRPTLPLTFSKRKQLTESPSAQRRFNRTITANQTIIPKKQGYRLEDGRMFELLSEGTGRRMAMVRELQHIKVKDYCGRGILVFPNGKKFQGEWVQGRLIGNAKITQSNGDVYVGNTYNFHPHGHGTITYANGEKYVGEFSSGDCHGEGILYDAEGIVIYQGEWRRGKRVDN